MAVVKQLLNLDKVLGKARNRISRVGIELEGGWTKLLDGVKPQHDGSVRISQGSAAVAGVPPAPSPATRRVPGRRLNDSPLTAQDIADAVGPADLFRLTVAKKVPELHIGEITSEPRTVDQVGIWVKRYYPQVVNESCGLHVHMSFKSAMHYQRLMVPEYTDVMIKYLLIWANEKGFEKKHPIWERLGGNSTYCQRRFYADQQVQARGKDYHRDRPGHRYTVINYCWNMYNTLECRVLPMFEKVEEALGGINKVLDITNAFLVVSAAREEKLKAEVEGDPTKIMDTKHVHIYPSRMEDTRS